jgi:hypothetical protein
MMDRRMQGKLLPNRDETLQMRRRPTVAHALYKSDLTSEADTSFLKHTSLDLQTLRKLDH